MISHPFETKSDSFYFVAVDDDVEKLILHNKAGEQLLLLTPSPLFYCWPKPHSFMINVFHSIASLDTEYAYDGLHSTKII